MRKMEVYGDGGQEGFEGIGNGVGMRTPLLSQGGVAAPLTKYREASLAGADGVVRSKHRAIGS